MFSQKDLEGSVCDQRGEMVWGPACSSDGVHFGGVSASLASSVGHLEALSTQEQMSVWAWQQAAETAPQMVPHIIVFHLTGWVLVLGFIYYSFVAVLLWVWLSTQWGAGKKGSEGGDEYAGVQGRVEGTIKSVSLEHTCLLCCLRPWIFYTPTFEEENILSQELDKEAAL